MRLADFILQNMDRILGEWQDFASTMLPAARNMGALALRDDAQQILEAVSKDLTTQQTRHAQHRKSQGKAPKIVGAPETAAQTHALLRARSGFDISQLVAEYRALRASVLRLWIDECQPLTSDFEDMLRFNEAIDQAVAESVGFFHAEVEQARNLMLGMLGHDMRTPMQSILSTASYLAALNAGQKVSEAAQRLIRSGASINALLGDLCDFNRTKLGMGIDVTPSDVNLAEVFSDALDQIRAAHPGRRIDLEVQGNVQGNWDRSRLQQVLSNLTLNALRYGAQDTPVRVAIAGHDAEVRFEVANKGPAIDPLTLYQLFNPLQRGLDPEDRNPEGLGLGLYIIKEITKAHHGSVNVRSDEAETAFEVCLPRRLTN